MLQDYERGGEAEITRAPEILHVHYSSHEGGDAGMQYLKRLCIYTQKLGCVHDRRRHSHGERSDATSQHSLILYS